MTTAALNSHRGTATSKEAAVMDLSITTGDLKKPMGDVSSATQATAQESYNQQSFAFLDRSTLIRPLADASEISTSARREGEPSIAELQSVFASQARIRRASANCSKGSLMNDNSRISLGGSSRKSLSDRLQQQWNSNSFQDSFGSIDSSAARAEGDDSGDSEEEGDKVLKLPVLSKQSVTASSPLFGESLLDFESVCFEPELASREGLNSLSAKKYASGIGALAQVGRTTTAAIMGSKKEILADISEGSKEHSDPKELLEDSSMADYHNSRKALLADVSAGSKKLRSTRRDRSRSSKSPTRMVVRQDSKSPRRSSMSPKSRRTRRGGRERTSPTMSRRRHSKREESPPPLLVDRPQRRKSSKGTEVRRAKSSEMPRPLKARSTRPRRANSSDEGIVPFSARRSPAHHQRRLSSFDQVAMDIDSPRPTLAEVALDIDLDDGDDESPHEYHEPRRSVLLQAIKKAVKAKDETNKRRSTIMDQYFESLLEDIDTTEPTRSSAGTSSSGSDRRQPSSRSSRRGSSKPISRTDASHSPSHPAGREPAQFLARTHVELLGHV